MFDDNSVDDVDWMGASLTLRRYLHWGWVPLAAAVLGAAAGAAMPASVESTSSASVTLGLSEEATYPFYDAILARQPGLIEDQELLTQAEAATGEQASSLTVDSSPSFSLSQIVLTVEAGSADAARALVDDLAERLVEANRVRRSDELSAEVARIEAAVGEQQVDLDELTAEIALLSTRVGEIGNLLDVGAGDRGALGAEREIARTRLGLLGREADAAEVLQGQLEGDFVRTELELEALRGEVQIARRAQILPTDRAFPLAAIVGALGALVGLAAIPFLDHRLGKVRTAAQTGRMFPGSPVVDLTATDGIGGSNSIAGAALLLPVGTERLAVAAPHSEKAAVRVALALEEAADLEATPIRLDSAQAAGQIATSDALVLVVGGGVRRLPLSRLSGQLRALGRAPDVVVFGDSDHGGTGGSRK